MHVPVYTLALLLSKNHTVVLKKKNSSNAYRLPNHQSLHQFFTSPAPQITTAPSPRAITELTHHHQQHHLSIPPTLKIHRPLPSPPQQNGGTRLKNSARVINWALLARVRGKHARARPGYRRVRARAGDFNPFITREREREREWAAAGTGEGSSHCSKCELYCVSNSVLWPLGK